MVTPPPALELDPARATKYRPIAELGRGGMATVYLAVVQGPAGFNKLQVVKRLSPALAEDPEFLTMFLEEARLAARISHPNIIQTNEIGYDGQYHFIAMEYVEGLSLEAIRKTAGADGLPLRLHIYILTEILAGLHGAHELLSFEGQPLNVVHRDVSPHNVMISYDGHVKVLDFGIAKAADSSGNTRTGVIKGKTAYMAPEQFRARDIDRRADVFAVGVMLWQAITGQRLWKGLSDSEIFARLMAGEIARPSEIKPQTPQELDEICMKALAINQEDRFASAAEFQAALESFAAALPRVTSREVGAWLAERFAAKRAAVRSLIEAELRKPRSAPSNVPDAPPPSSTATDIPVLSAIGTDSRTATAAPAVTNASRATRLGLYGAVTVVIAGVALFAGAQRSSPAAVKSPGADLPAAPLGDVRAPPVASSAAPKLIHLQIEATPSEAHLFLDDASIEGNPAAATLPQDGAKHTVRAEAHGYETKRELVIFDAPNVRVDLTLARDALQQSNPRNGKPPATSPERPRPSSPQPPIRVTDPPSTPAPAPQTPPVATSTAAPPPQTVIDRGDPWAQKKP